MKITTKITISIATGEVMEHEFYEYSGPVALACGATPGQQQLAQQQTSGYTTLVNQAQGYRNAKAAVGNAESAVGGGNTGDTSGGATVGENLSLAENAANQTSSELTNIKEADYNQGRENYFNAASGLAGAPGVFGTANQAGSVATGAGEAAEKSQNDVASQDNSWVGAVTGALGNVAGMATGGFMKNLGSGSTSGKSSTPSQ
jgi:hypothetical protein